MRDSLIVRGINELLLLSSTSIDVKLTTFIVDKSKKNKIKWVKDEETFPLDNKKGIHEMSFVVINKELLFSHHRHFKKASVMIEQVTTMKNKMPKCSHHNDDNNKTSGIIRK